MSAARIHDKQRVKLFWEQWIVEHSRHEDEEEQRARSSALARLRDQWVVRLNQRNQHQLSFFEERIRRAQKAQLQSPGKLPSACSQHVGPVTSKAKSHN